MIECSRNALDTIQRLYPMIKAVKWNSRKACFEIFEEISEDACLRLRRIIDYCNDDGTPVPFIADRALNMLRRADTRLWPLAERMKLYDQEDEEFEQKQDEELRETIGARIREDYRYIAGIPTFFFGDDMKVGRAGYRPGQGKILKQWGET